MLTFPPLRRKRLKFRGFERRIIPYSRRKHKDFLLRKIQRQELRPSGAGRRLFQQFGKKPAKSKTQQKRHWNPVSHG